MSVPDQEPYSGVPALDGGTKRHPTFVALVGFYVGMGLMITIPSIFTAIVGALGDTGALRSFAPLLLLPFAIPVVLIVVHRTRRFGRYMLLGMVSTALVVGIVGGIVLWWLVGHS